MCWTEYTQSPNLEYLGIQDQIGVSCESDISFFILFLFLSQSLVSSRVFHGKSQPGIEPQEGARDLPDSILMVARELSPGRDTPAFSSSLTHGTAGAVFCLFVCLFRQSRNPAADRKPITHHLCPSLHSFPYPAHIHEDLALRQPLSGKCEVYN